MAANNRSTNNTEASDIRPNLSLLVEAAENRPEGTDKTMEESDASSHPIEQFREPPIGGTPVSDTMEDGSEALVEGSRAEDKAEKRTVISPAENSRESTEHSLEVLASAAQNSEDITSASSNSVGGSSTSLKSTNKAISEVIRSKAETKKEREALLKAAKSLSNDPLVQLSLLRAMQRQQVPPDTIRKNKEKREKDVEAQQKKNSQKRKAVLAAAPSAKSQKSRDGGRSSKPTLRENVVSSTSTAAAARPIPQQVSENFLETSQPQIGRSTPFPGQVAQKSDPNILNGTLALVQSLLSVIQPNQLQPQSPQQSLANLPQLQNKDTTTQVLELIRNLGNGIPVQQQVALAQTLLPHLSGAVNASTTQSSNNTTSSNDNATRVVSPKSWLEDSRSDKDKSRSSSSQEVRIPCRARGMPLDHNFQSAHFVLPKNIKHGQDLVCSYAACRDGGIKFRYCLYCRIPVSKRNFRLRHHHIDSSTQRPSPDVMVPSSICVDVHTPRASEMSVARDRAVPAHAGNTYYQSNEDQSVAEHGRVKNHKRDSTGRHHKDSDKEKLYEAADHAAATENIANAGNSSKREKKKKKRHKKNFSSKRQKSSVPKVASLPPRQSAEVTYVDDTNHQGMNVSNDVAKRDVLKSFGKNRLRMWASLLEQRPSKDDEDNMSKWLMNVLAVSDLKTPLRYNVSSEKVVTCVGENDSSD